MHVGAARAHRDAGGGDVGLGQTLGEDRGAAHGALLTLDERGARRELERGRLRRDHVHERSALLTQEDGGVDLLGEVGIVGQDEARARAADRLVHRRRHDVGVGHGRGVQARRDEAGEVRHVDPEQGADLVGDLAEAREVELAGVGRPPGDDDLGRVLDGEALDLVHVDDRGLGVDAVRDDVVEPAREVDLHAVREVPAVVERQAEQGVAGARDGVQHGGVGGCPGVRLHVGELGTEQCLGACDRELFGDVDLFAAAVVATAGVALGVLVGEHRALRLQDRDGHEVLRGDHLEVAALAVELALEHLGDLGVDLGERGVEVRVGHNRLLSAG